MMNFGPAERARMVKDSIDLAEKKGVLGAGFIPKSRPDDLHRELEGTVRLLSRGGGRDSSLTCRMPDGSGSGWAGHRPGIKDTRA